MSTNRSAEDVERTKIDPLRLRIREDPQAGFFVDGVTKYHLSTFSDAVEFINFGLWLLIGWKSSWKCPARSRSPLREEEAVSDQYWNSSTGLRIPTTFI